MVKVSGIDFAKRAHQLGRRFDHFNLPDGSTANLSISKNAFDCFVVKNDQILEARGASGSPQHVNSQLYAVVSKLVAKCVNAK